MDLPKHILVPVDFSGNSELALDYAVGLAAQLHATVHVLNVIGPQALGTELAVSITQTAIDPVLESNQKHLDRLVAARAGRATFGPTLLEVGDPYVKIDGAAHQVHADLIVMGTRGRHGIKRMLLGSVAEATARTAPCPVLLVREPT